MTSILLESVNKQIFNINWDVKQVYREKRNYRDSDLIGKDLAIIIDNGSYECRAGWSISENPDMRFRSLVGKPKIPIKGQETLFLVGNEMLHIDPGKLHKKSPFEKNYITHFGTQEHILDYIFANLKTENTLKNSVEFPVVMTEPLFNLNWSRKNLTEMMFELYSVPSLAYGVDMLFSYDYNQLLRNQNWNSYDSDLSSHNCLIISCSYQTTHIILIINGKLRQDKVRRLGIGAFHGNELLTKSLNLRFPDVRSKFTSELLTEIQEKYTMCAIDYKSQLKIFQNLFQHDQQKLKEEENKRLYGSLEMYEKANYEELRQIREKEDKYKHLKTYKNMIQYQNENSENDDSFKIIKDLAFLELPKFSNDILITDEELKKRQEVRKEQSRRLREIMQRKKEENIRSLEKELAELEEILELNNSIDKYQMEETLLTKGFTSIEELQKRINKIYMKINFNKEKSEERVDEEKRWPLLSVPDEDLTEDQIKMKKIHKMQRQAYLNRLDKREKLKKEKEKVEELRQRDPESYLVSLYRRKKELLDRLEKYKAARKDITNRSSKANRGRMMVLAELGKDSKKGETQIDDFGVNDEDWEVYRGISKHNLSEDEEEDTQQLQEVEAQIIENDPNYFKYSEDVDENLFFSSKYLCLGVDQFRGAELLFQPHIIGTDQAGLIELILSVFKTLSHEEQRAIAGNIFLTGGFASTPFLRDRIYKDLRENIPCDIDINITLADDPELDSWKGAKNFFYNKQTKEFFISRAEYLEYGAEYFKEHFCSNVKYEPNKSVVLGYYDNVKKQKII